MGAYLGDAAGSAEDVAKFEMGGLMEAWVVIEKVEKEDESEEAVGDHNLEGASLQKSRREEGLTEGSTTRAPHDTVANAYLVYRTTISGNISNIVFQY